MSLDHLSSPSSGVSKVALLAFLATLGCSAIQRPNQGSYSRPVTLNIPDEGVDLLRKAMEGGCGLLESEDLKSPKNAAISVYIDRLIVEGRFEEARAMEEALFALGDRLWLRERPNVHGVPGCAGVRAAVACQLGAACGEKCEVVDELNGPQARYDGAESRDGADYLADDLTNPGVTEKRIAEGETGGAYINGVPWYQYQDGQSTANGREYAAMDDAAVFLRNVVSGEGSYWSEVDRHLMMKDKVASAVVDGNLLCWQQEASKPEVEAYVHAAIRTVLGRHLKGMADNKRSVVGKQYMRRGR